MTDKESHQKFNAEAILFELKRGNHFNMINFSILEELEDGTEKEHQLKVDIISMHERVIDDDPLAKLLAEMGQTLGDDSNKNEKKYDISLRVKSNDDESKELGKINGVATVKNGKIENLTIFSSQAAENFGYTQNKNEPTTHIPGLMRDAICHLAASGIFDDWYSSNPQALSPGGKLMYKRILELSQSDEIDENSIYKQITVTFEEESFDGEPRYRLKAKK